MIKFRGGWALRLGLLLLTFVVALAALRSGVEVTEHIGETADLWTHTYWALGLFVLGGLDIGVPTGGPAAMRATLWVAYFLAPTITTSAVVEGALRVLQPAWLRRALLVDHVVVVGLGRVGKTFLEALREQEPRARILIVVGDAAGVQVLASRFGVSVLEADVRDESTLEAMRLERARAVVLLTGDDLVNLEVGSRVKRHRPNVNVVAHVADIGMRRLVERSASKRPLRIFNSHRVAARGLHERYLSQWFAQTVPRDIVVIAGFGRFGQTILEHLLLEARGQLARAVVVDVAAESRERMFHAQVDGTDGCAIRTVAGDVDDPSTWARVDEAIATFEVEPTFVLCTHDDSQNLRAAIALREAGKSGPIFVRCGDRSEFTDGLARERDFVVLGEAAMLRQTIQGHLREWLGEPT